MFIWSPSFAVIKQHQITEFVTLWASTCTAMKAEQCSRDVFKDTRRRETRQNRRTAIFPSSSTPFPFLLRRSISTKFTFEQLFLFLLVVINFTSPGTCQSFSAVRFPLMLRYHHWLPCYWAAHETVIGFLVTLHGCPYDRESCHEEVNLHIFLIKVI